MNILFLIVCFFWLIRLVGNLISYINLWFVKEYRIDRMLIHLKTNQGKMLLFLPFRKPPVSPKTIVLFGVVGISILSTLSYLSSLRINIFLQLFIIDILLFPYIGLWVWILSLPTNLYHKYIFQKAFKKLTSHKKMTVIGITGSYGKTSVKEFLTTILAKKYKVLKTEGSKNSLIGICETIIDKLEDDHEIFIVEMGAYKVGEIKHIANLVKPEIGIVTAINSQHQDLFGSIKTTMKAKYELISSLNGIKTAVFNADNKFTQQMAIWATNDDKSIIFYSANPKIKPDSNSVIAKNIKVSLSGIEFEVVYQNQLAKYTASILGKHQVSNILGAVSIALAIGMKLKDLIEPIKNLKTFPKTMQKIIGVKGSIFINDTFNNNPDAAKAALSYLKLAKGRKILVFQPMIELGDYAEISHQEVGEYAANICDQIYLTNANFYNDFIKGLVKVKPKMKIVIMSLGKIAENLKTDIGSSDTVLFKGKESENVLLQLL